MSTLTMIMVIAVQLLTGFLCGLLYAAAKEHKNYIREAERMTAQICQRMRKAMRSLGYDEETIDKVQDRMAIKVFPPRIPMPSFADIYCPDRRIKYNRNKAKEMKQLVINIPDNVNEAFVERLTSVLKDAGFPVGDQQEANSYEPKAGDIVAFADDSCKDTPFIGIFKEWYHDSRDKIVCYAHINSEGRERDEEEYWQADEVLRPATDEEKEELIKALERNQKRWNPETMEFDSCEAYEAIHTYEDAFSKVNDMAAQGDKLADLLIRDLQFNSPRTPDLLAYIKLRIIVHAINDGWTPKFTKDEYRYYPWFYLYTQEEVDKMNEEERSRLLDVGGYANFGAACGVSCAISSYAFSSSDASLGARLAFYDERRAKYAGTKFLELYSALNFLPPTSIAEEVTE